MRRVLVVVGIVTAGSLVFLLGWMSIRVDEFHGLADLGPVDRYEPGSITSAEAPGPRRAVRMFVVRGRDGSWTALRATDPRNGCRLGILEGRDDLGWAQIEHAAFADPCHGSVYARDGTVLEGPSPVGLDRFPVDVTSGRVLIDTRRRIPGSRRT